MELRNSVLRQPLGMDISNDDLSDEASCQFLAYYSNNEEMLGCLKIKKLDDNTFQIQQMAVIPDHQGQGIGSALLKKAEKLIREQGGEKVVIEARDYALPFYKKYGYQESGEKYEKINIPHHLMRKYI